MGIYGSEFFEIKEVSEHKHGKVMKLTMTVMANYGGEDEETKKYTTSKYLHVAKTSLHLLGHYVELEKADMRAQIDREIADAETLKNINTVSNTAPH